METTARENRVFPRKPLHGDGEISDTQPGAKRHIKTLDISLGGLSFLSSIPFPEGSMWLVHFKIGAEPLNGVVRIVYCAKHSMMDAFRLGAEFNELDSGQRQLIQKYLG